VLVVYFDASALVKLVIDEDGSDIAAELWDSCDAALASRLAYPEVRAALAAAERGGLITSRDGRQAVREWQAFWAGIRPIELSSEVEQRAGELASTQALRGADAVHLASALTLGITEAVVAAWDERLHAAAAASGLAVAPARLD